MQRSNRELWYALLTIALITAGYDLAIVRLGEIPAASGLVGHGLGIVGFLLMLMTETLYSLRRRSRYVRWGRMATWLRVHIFTGVVGPYLVLLHTSWKFNGLAGAVMLLTLVVVVSGFTGRYIYTAIPRTASGIEVEIRQLESEIAAAEVELQNWLADARWSTGPLVQRLAYLPEGPHNPLLLVLGRPLLEWNYHLQWWRAKRRMDPATRAQARELEKLVGRRRTLHRQRASMAVARRMLATWRSIHIPISVVLFTAALVHIGAAIYYATLLR